MLDPTRLAFSFYGCCGGFIAATITIFLIVAWLLGSGRVVVEVDNVEVPNDSIRS